MRKPVIGILAPRRFNEEDPFECQSRFVDNYPKRVMEAGGIPIGLLFPNEKFIEDEIKFGSQVTVDVKDDQFILE